MKPATTLLEQSQSETDKLLSSSLITSLGLILGAPISMPTRKALLQLKPGDLILLLEDISRAINNMRTR